jgi:phosphoglycerate dehydrogenase-like enzyme
MAIHVGSVLIADDIEQECIETLEKGGIRVEKKTKLSEAELIDTLKEKGFGALIVRSATKVSRSE